MIGVNVEDDSYDGDQDGYESIESASLHRRQPLQQTALQDDEESNYLYPPDSAGSASTRPDVPLQQSGGIQGIPSTESASVGSGSQPPLLEIPEEIYAVRKAALKVLKPLTKTWVRTVI
jgi:hypothetical protein